MEIGLYSFGELVPDPHTGRAIGPRQRWWIWRVGPALVAGILVAILAGWPVALIAAGLILSAGALFSYRVSPAFSLSSRYLAAFS